MYFHLNSSFYRLRVVPHRSNRFNMYVGAYVRHDRWVRPGHRSARVLRVQERSPTDVGVVVQVGVLELVRVEETVRCLFQFRDPTVRVFIRELFVGVYGGEIYRVADVSHPLVRFRADLRRVGVDVRVVPRFLIVNVIDQHEFVVAICLPVNAPIFFFASVFRGAHRRVLVVSNGARGLDTRQLVERVTRARDLTLQWYNFVPVSCQVAVVVYM